jgi:hypothetical protein
LTKQTDYIPGGLLISWFLDLIANTNLRSPRWRPGFS